MSAASSSVPVASANIVSPSPIVCAGLTAIALVGVVLASQAVPLSAAESVDTEIGPEIVVLKPEVMEPGNTAVMG